MITDYEDLRAALSAWERAGARVRVVGKSLFGRELYEIRVGDDSARRVAVTAGIHAREYPTTDAALAMLERAAERVSRCGGGLWVLPCVNPDGAELCRRGLASAPRERRDYLRELNGGDDFSQWKANGRGVDLNVNFPARWGTGKHNVFVPSPSDFVGEYPASEPETAAMIAWTQRVRPLLTLSLHAKGRELYWEFGQVGGTRARDERIARFVSEWTGYRKVDGTLGSAGGYKDYCVESLHIPALTLEIGRDEAVHPLPREELEKELPLIRDLAAELLECTEVL